MYYIESSGKMELVKYWQRNKWLERTDASVSRRLLGASAAPPRPAAQPHRWLGPIGTMGPAML
jgi:hypothetical protein